MRCIALLLINILSACSSMRIDDTELADDSYKIGCYDAVYSYILIKDKASINLPDSLYADDYCRFMWERRDKR